MKGGNATGGKAVALGNIHWETAAVLSNGTTRKTHPMKNAVCTQKHTGHKLSEEPDAGKLHVRFYRGADPARGQSTRPEDF